MDDLITEGACLVIGNGPGPIPELKGTVICFNDAEIVHSKLIRVESGHNLGLTRQFVLVSNFDVDEFQLQLIKTANEIEKVLNVWPSSGLVSVLALEKYSKSYDVYRMPLAPSLCRGDEWAPNIANAVSYHNWLGERRHIFSQLTKRWDSLYLPKPLGGKPFEYDPFEILMSDDINLKALETLANCSSEYWLKWTTAEKLKLAEAKFYLHRSNKKSRNWWLFDRRGAEKINRIFIRLAWCQQSLYG